MKSRVLVRAMLGVAALAIAIPTVAKVTAKAPRYGAFGIDLGSQDQAIKPGDDFWTFANGSWAKRTEIPADKRSVGYSNILADEAEANVRKILDDMAANPAKYGAGGKQVGDFYASWMDEAGIEAKGAAPLKPYLDRIAAVKDLSDLQVLFASVGYASPVEIDTTRRSANQVARSVLEAVGEVLPQAAEEPVDPDDPLDRPTPHDSALLPDPSVRQ